MDETESDEQLLCHRCVTDTFLSAEIIKKGKSGVKRRSYTLEQIADRVEEAFEQHFEITNDQPTEEEYWRQHVDKKSAYWWYQNGESLPFLLEDIGGIP
jgi:hypothetical protein